MRLAHISDLHLASSERVALRRYLNKRVTGVANLVGFRRSHSNELARRVVDELAERLERGEIDHVALTGDLTNLALETEFELARSVLAPIARPEHLSVVPGNHDVYTKGSEREARFEAYFADLLWRGDEPHTYPWAKHVGRLALFGLRSVRALAPLMAHGHVPDDQLDRLRRLVAEAVADGCFPVVLVHHNLHARGARKDHMHGLRNRAEVLRACSESGVGLLLHGHTHQAHRLTYDRLEVIGSGSTTWDSTDPRRTGRYNVYEIEEGALRRVVSRVYDRTTGRFEERASS